MMDGNQAAAFTKRQGGRGGRPQGPPGARRPLWDAEAVNETTGKTMALFRCTQMVLYPR